MPRPTETANLYEPESLDDFSEMLKNNEKVVVYFYTSVDSECKITKPIIRSLAYKYKDILFFLVNVDRHEDIADEYGNIKRTYGGYARAYGRIPKPKVILFRHGQSKAEIYSFHPYAKYSTNAYDIYEKEISTTFA
ncbi:hypothetical protein RMATCC62417_10184 [Rhizopus microsporus]|nr:hypothetical protein RMATCC62417_10184 [Rhizopus microsporus]